MIDKTDRQFPVHPGDSKALPRTVPWKWVEQFVDSIQHVHGQTLERLAERGGLSWCELLGHGLRGENVYHAIVTSARTLTTSEARDKVMKLITEWTERANPERTGG